MPPLRQSFPLYGVVFVVFGAAASSPALSGDAEAADASANNTATLELPSDWAQLPDLAEAARAAAAAAAGDAIEVAVEAWGDPASGAFALLATTRASSRRSRPDDLAESLRTAATAAGAEISNWSVEDAPVGFSFVWGGFRGVARVRAHIDAENQALRGSLLACFYSARQPERSAAICQELVERFEVMR